MYNEGEADEARQLELDSVEEARYTALVQSARYLQGIRQYHDRNVRERSFNIGDLVLRRIQDESSLHKLNSRWEGPFIIKQVTRPGSYRLQHPEGQDVPNSWNIQNLRKSTHGEARVDSCSPVTSAAFFLPNQIGGCVSQNSECKFFC
jgi:hypothetical protein